MTQDVRRRTAPAVAPYPLPLSKAASGRSIGNPPDAVAAIVGDQQGAVLRHGYAYGTAPDVADAGVGDEAGEEVFVTAGGLPVLEADAHDLVAGARGTVPGAV